MILVGILVTFLGFVISVLSLATTSSVGGRLIIVLLGLAVSLFGILGVLNPAYLKNAIWKKGYRQE
jgi:cytochrome c biogenesis protein CcdA